MQRQRFYETQQAPEIHFPAESGRTWQGSFLRASVRCVQRDFLPGFPDKVTPVQTCDQWVSYGYNIIMFLLFYYSTFNAMNVSYNNISTIPLGTKYSHGSFTSVDLFLRILKKKNFVFLLDNICTTQSSSLQDNYILNNMTTNLHVFSYTLNLSINHYTLIHIIIIITSQTIGISYMDILICNINHANIIIIYRVQVILMFII